MALLMESVDGMVQRGLGDSRGVMVSHMVEAWSGAMVAPTTGCQELCRSRIFFSHLEKYTGRQREIRFWKYRKYRPKYR
jgi:hypothetical protein